MGWEAWATIAVVVLMAIALARNWAAPDVILMGALVLLMTIAPFSDKLPPPQDFFRGFGNEGLVTVAVLFVVAMGLTQTGAMSLITQPLLGRPKTVIGAQVRLMLPVAALSAFLNNTPLVAMFMPVVQDWCKKSGLSPSKLFIPLSYAAILGGTCTLIGTSTNLVVNGLLQADPNERPLSLFAIVPIGVPCAIIGIAYVFVASKFLLPDRKPALSIHDDPRQYSVDMVVDPAGPLVGQTIEQAGLRHLPGLYLTEIDREGDVRVAVGPDAVLHANDRLVFVGVVESVVDLRKMRGLLPATNQVFKIRTTTMHRCLVEAVVGKANPLIGKSVREGRFRSVYDAAVIAVARDGRRIEKKVGDIVLEAGDTLLIETRPEFVERQKNRRDFYLVSRVDNSTPPRHDRAWVALLILGAMVTAAGFEWLSMLHAALLAAGLMVLTRCCNATQARQALDWQVLIVIGAAFGVGKCIEASGAAQGIASTLLELVQGNRTLTLVAMYGLTMIFTAFITNNAAAVLMFPIAKAAAAGLDVSMIPFAIAVMFAASNDFATPIGYQTNLMVYGPGGYRFSDYVRFGGPLNLLMLVTAVILIPLVYGW